MINLYFTQVDSPCGTLMYQIISVDISYALSNLKLFMKWEKIVLCLIGLQLFYLI